MLSFLLSTLEVTSNSITALRVHGSQNHDYFGKAIRSRAKGRAHALCSLPLAYLI